MSNTACAIRSALTLHEYRSNCRVKIRNFRFHDLRHTFCSWLAIRGVPLTAIQELAGHASIKMTLRYAHLSPRYLADEVKVLDRFLQDGEPKEGPPPRKSPRLEANEARQNGRARDG